MTALALSHFSDPGLTADTLIPRMLWLRDVIGPRLERYLGYYRNHTTELAATLPCSMSASFAVRPFRQYQELGLPARITGFRRAADGAATATGAIDVQRKEVVIENDICWRINTLVDFAAGRMPAINSTAADEATRNRLTRVLRDIFSAAGGGMLLQQLVVQGAVSGSAWVQIRPTTELLRALRRLSNSTLPTTISTSMMGESDAGGSGSGTGAMNSDPDSASTGTSATSTDPEGLDVSRWFQLEIVNASDLCPLPQGGDFSGDPSGLAYAAVLARGDDGAAQRPALLSPGILERVRSWFTRPGASSGATAEEFSFDLFGASLWQRYVRGQLAQEGPNLLGFVPFVRYENAAEVAAGSRVGPAGSGAVNVGAGEVEPLIGLQDELNTRLSDRAYRVTMTSFRMWLGRGIEDFTKRPVGPGQMWATDNPAASIEGFGGDSSAPSEESHIGEIREALDKISGVPPVAAGVLRAKLGNLTSAVALRVTLIALLARTERKRAALTHTMEILARRLLEILDKAGIVASSPADRGIDVNWPTALPESDMDRLHEAQVKVALGIPRGVVLGELGYAEVASPAVAAPAIAAPAIAAQPVEHAPAISTT